MTDDDKPKTVYDWILTCGQGVDYWHGVYRGWFQNDMAEEYAYRTGDDALGPNEMKLNGVVLTFEILDALKNIPIPADFPLAPTDEPWRFWEDLGNGEYYG